MLSRASRSARRFVTSAVWGDKAGLASSAAKPNVVVVGGGAGGLAVASGILPHANVTVVEPSSTHWYQPMFTLVGGGAKVLSDARKPMKSLIPNGATWVPEAVTRLDPDNNSLVLDSGASLSYDYLVMAAGLELQWDRVDGLRDTLNENGVSSNYSPTSVESTWRNIRALAARARNGEHVTWLGTQPPQPFKCAGAPQKILYLAEEYFRTKARDGAVSMQFATAMPTMFAVPRYNETLEEYCDSRRIVRHHNANLVAVRGAAQEAVFATESGEKVVNFDALHVTPPQGPLPFYAKSPLADESGFVAVDKETTQHVKYSNVFSLGDCSTIPTSKTAAAVAAQCGVTINNLASTIHNMPLHDAYNGYTSCPLVMGRNSLLLAEFVGPGYGGTPLETFGRFVDQSKPNSAFYKLKAEIMPHLYWDYLLKGDWKGPGLIRDYLGKDFAEEE